MQDAVIGQQLAEQLPEIVRAASESFKHIDNLTVLNGAQGITEASGILLPQKLRRTLPASSTTVEVRALSGETKLDALLVRPVVSRLVVVGDTGRTELVRNSTASPQPTTVDGTVAADGWVALVDDGRSHAVSVDVPRRPAHDGEARTLSGRSECSSG